MQVLSEEELKEVRLFIKQFRLLEERSREYLQKVEALENKIKQMENFLFLDDPNLETLYNKNKERHEKDKES